MTNNEKIENYKNYKNRGMLLEQLLNQTITHYRNNKIAYFFKKNLDIKFLSAKKDDKKLKIYDSFIYKKSTVDYFGIYKGKYVTFEAKSTEENKICFSNIKEHQHKHLLEIDFYGGKAFYIFFFKTEGKIFVVDVKNLNFYEKKSLSIDEAKKIGEEVEIIFPGIIDFVEFI